jgi:hypothetical protein
MASLLGRAEQLARHTCSSINWKNFLCRAQKLASSVARIASTRPTKDREKDKKEKEAVRARAILFNGQTEPETGRSQGRTSELPRASEEGIPFFAALSAALAVGLLSLRSSSSRSDDGMAVDFVGSSSSDTSVDPGYWYALSVQALSVYEGSFTSGPDSQNSDDAYDYGLDYLSACLLQVAFLLKGGSAIALAGYNRLSKSSDTGFGGIEGVLFPLVRLLSCLSSASSHLAGGQDGQRRSSDRID